MSIQTEPAFDPAIDYSQKWFVMAAVAMGVFLATIDGSIVNIALPTLVQDLNTNFATVQWVVLAYLLTLGTLLLSVGRFADIHGKKRIYATGFVVFTIGSVLSGLSVTIYMLIGMRVIQAVGAAMVFALGTAIVTEAFPASERGKALGIIGAIVSIGIVAGPTLGGLILEDLSWHWIFFVNLPVGIIGTFMVIRYVPNVAPTGGSRFDWLGAVLLFVSLLALLLALTFGQNRGFTDPSILGLFVFFFVTFALFIFVELRIGEPMIDLRLFQNKPFSINLFTGFLTFVAIAGMILILPFYLQDILGYDVQTVGLLLAVTPIALGVSAPISGIVSDRIGSRPVTVIGLAILLLGYLAISTLDQNTSITGYILRLIPVGLGMGIFQSPNNSAIMGAAPKRAMGIASSLLAVSRTLGQTTGIAVLGAVWAARSAFYAGGPLSGGATTAPIDAQVSALQDTYLVAAGLVLIALVVGSWALINERIQKTRAKGVGVTQ